MTVCLNPGVKSVTCVGLGLWRPASQHLEIKWMKMATEELHLKTHLNENGVFNLFLWHFSDGGGHRQEK